MRRGEYLQEAVDYCAQRGLHFFAENENYRGETIEKSEYSRKLKSDLFIDDRNLGGLPDWGVIYNVIKAMDAGHPNPLALLAGNSAMPEKKKKKGWFRL